MDHLLALSAVEMAEKIRRKNVSPVELMEAHLRHIEEINPRLNAFIALDFDGALRQARIAEKRLMQARQVGPLHGVPISIKSSIEVSGLAFETGSKLRSGIRGVRDAPLVARLKASGAIVLGTTNVPELLMNYFTDNAVYGRTNSPLDPARTPGGSSGGEAAAIAACMAAAGIGSDGGGSIRVPAHYCGIFGLKPTPGRIPITGHHPESGGPFASMGVVGPMARSARDLEVIFQITAGFNYLDPLAAPASFRRRGREELKKIRIGYFEDDGHTPVTPETARSVRTAVAALRAQGLEVVPFRPARIREARANWWVFFVLCGAAVIEPLFQSRPMDISPGLREFLDLAKASAPLTRDLLLRSWFERDQIRLDILREMQSYPLLLSPVCAIPAFKHGERRWTIAGREVDYLDAMSYSQWLNAVGFPGLSVPVGRSPEGLSIGVQIIALPYEDEAALALAQVLEEALQPARGGSGGL